MAEQSSAYKYRTPSSKSVRLEEVPSTQNRTQTRRENLNQTSNTRLKTQIDAILQNDLSVLSKHPDTPHRALLTTHNNPLILRYVRNIYQEYQLKDPLPQRYQRYEKYEENKQPESPQRLKRNQGKHKNKKKIQITKNIDIGERTIEKKGKYLQRQHLKTQYKQQKEEMRQYQTKNIKRYYQYQSQHVQKPNPRQSFQLTPSEQLITPPRRKINFIYRSQKTQQPQIVTHPTHASTSPSPQHGAKGDQVQHQISIRQDNQFQSPICRASNRYFDSGEGIRQEQRKYVEVQQQFQQEKSLISFNSKLYESIPKQLMPTFEDSRQRERIIHREEPLKRQLTHQERGKIKQSNILIEVSQGHSSDIMDQNLKEFDFYVPQLMVLAGHGKNKEEEEVAQQKIEELSNIQRIEEVGVRQNEVSSQRFIAIRPLPQIITFKSSRKPKDQSISRRHIYSQQLQQPQISSFQPQQQASQPLKNQAELPQEISQAFRYCLGCQQALLEANIPNHERKCRRFKQLLELSPHQLIQYLKKKIHCFEDNIRKYSSELLRTDSQQISYHSQKMMEQSDMIFDSGKLSEKYNEEYSEVLTVSRKWMNITEEISKVNWFLKVRETIKKQLEV